MSLLSRIIEIGGVRIECCPLPMEELEVTVRADADTNIQPLLAAARHVEVTLKHTSTAPEFYEGPVTFNMRDGSTITVQGTVRKEPTP